MIDRRQSRILAMQALCQLDVLGEEFLQQLDDFLADDAPPSDVRKYAGELVRGAWGQREAIEAKLAAVAEHWVTGRMTMVDRNILRAAVCELMTRSDVSAAVVINEAVEIARSYGTADSPAFINGILDAVRKSMNSEKPG